MFLINHRGTKDFTIETSTDQTNWELAVSETLPSAIDVDACQIPIKSYSVQVYARYLRYTLVNYYEKGAGLNHISWDLFKF